MSQIHEKMIAVMRDLTHVSKSQRNEAQGFPFRGIDDVLNAIGPALREHGVFLLPSVQDVATERIQTKSGGSANHTVVTVTYQFLSEDGSSVAAMGRGEAIDHGDKSVSKAMSMALKYVLFQTFALPTNEPDPDSEVHEVAQTVQNPDQMRELAQVRTALLDYANDPANATSPIKVATEFSEQYGHPLTQATLDELNEYHAKLQLGGQEVTNGGS